MHLAYCPSNLTDNSVTLDTEESLHITKVLRLGLGDEILVTDGKGAKALGTIVSAAKKNVSVSLSNTETAPSCPYQFELAIAPTKLMDRFEIVLEKCTELGIRKIHPILTFHSERRKLNIDRCRKIILSAMKQSQKTWLPEISEPVKFNDFISEHDGKNKLLAHCDKSIHRVSYKSEVTQAPTILCIGPEGDFSKEEISLATKHGYVSVHLGNERLRTETAAIFAHSTFQAINTL